MKKTLLFVIMFVSLFLITGCGKKTESSGGLLSGSKTMTCTRESVDVDGYKTSEKMEITYNSTRVLKVKSTTITETDPSYIDLQLSMGSLFTDNFSKIDGITAGYTKVDDNKLKLTMEVEYGKIKVEQIKEVLGDLYDDADSYYTKENYTIEDFKQENLEGYTCE